VSGNPEHCYLKGKAMKAIALTHYLPSNHPHCFIESDLPDPAPGPRDLLVRVNATSINPGRDRTLLMKFEQADRL
jgi:hypothetical protein